MHLLVTGGAGFIGSNLCEFFLKCGYAVTCFDNFSTGQIENILDLKYLYADTFCVIIGDICNLKECENLLSKYRFDCILHMAAYGSVPLSVEEPSRFIYNNIIGFANILDFAKKNNIKKVIYASSSSVYGDQIEIPQNENFTGAQLSPYAYSKYSNEMCAEVFSKCYDIKTIGFRFFNVYGKKQRSNVFYPAVIPAFIDKLIKHEQPLIYGDGNNSRDFTYVKDITSIINSAIHSENPKCWNQVYNAAYGQSIKINDLFYLIRDILSHYDALINKIQPVYVNPRNGDIKDSLASIRKANDLLNYKSRFSIKEGLEETIRWYIQK